MRLPLVIGFALAMSFAGTARAQTPAPAPHSSEGVVITPATEPRDGNWPFEESQAEPAPKAEPKPEHATGAPSTPAPSTPAPQTTVTVPADPAVPERAADPVGASAPAGAAAPTSVAGPSARAAARDRVAAARRVAVYRAAATESRFGADRLATEGRADDATSRAIAHAAGAGPLDSAGSAPAAVDARPVPVQAHAASPGQTDLTPLLLAIPLLFGGAVLAHRHGGVRRGWIRARGRRRAQTA